MNWRVIFQVSEKESDTVVITEFLRYAGVISFSNVAGYREISIWCPKNVAADRRQHWAESNAARINSFGPQYKAKADKVK